MQLKRLPLPVATPTLELRSKATDVLLVLHSLRHENLNPFIGILAGGSSGSGEASGHPN